MALSNWTKVMWAEDGMPVEQLCAPSGVVVRIYKDSLEVEDELAWRSDSSYVRPQVMLVHMGALTYRDVEIVALRGPRNGIYMFAWCRGSDWNDGGKFKGVVGVGLYAFSDEGKFSCVGDEEMRWLIEQVMKEDEAYHPGWSLADVPNVLVDVLRVKVMGGRDGLRCR